MIRKDFETIAAVDVGSNAISLIIAQVNKDSTVIPLEDLYQPTHIGKDTFATGRIQVSSIYDLCDTLELFAKLMKQYRVKNYRAVSTSGIREAENREYVLEQIRVKSGLEVEVINSAQTRFWMYKAIRNLITNSGKNVKANTLVTDIGAGGVEMSFYHHGRLRFTEYIKVGSLRLREILANLERKNLDFPMLMEEFIESRTDYLKPILSKININNFIGLGGELKTIIDICNTIEPIVNNYIKKDTIKLLYHKVYKLTAKQIVDEFSIQKNHAEILLPTVMLIYSFLKMSKTEGIYAPPGNLRYGLLMDMVDEIIDAAGKREALQDIINSVWYIADKYKVDREHAEYIEKLSLTIFDQTYKIHRLGEKERVYLQIAAILHDTGKYINLNNHDIQSYHIIRSQNIMGFSDNELELVANIARYHSHDIPISTDENYYLLENQDKIIVSKLTAILRIAEALDISHKRKIKELEISICDKEIKFNVWATADILLEDWNFSGNITFFEEVMGYRPILVQRR